MSAARLTSAGEPLKPLDEIASGGEMSRVMLALKVTVEEGATKGKRKLAAPRTLVFDEIDIGMDFDQVAKAGSMMGSAGVVVIDDHPCMVEFANDRSRFDDIEARLDVLERKTG